MKVSSIVFITAVALCTAGCGGMYVKPASATYQINTKSVEKAVKAAVTASGKVGWTPKVISVETGYLLAEYQPDVIGRNGGRDYAYKLEVRVPEGGRGDVQVTVTPPQGIMGGQPIEDMVKEFLDAYKQALKH